MMVDFKFLDKENIDEFLRLFSEISFFDKEKEFIFNNFGQRIYPTEICKNRDFFNFLDEKCHVLLEWADYLVPHDQETFSDNKSNENLMRSNSPVSLMQNTTIFTPISNETSAIPDAEKITDEEFLCLTERNFGDFLKTQKITFKPDKIKETWKKLEVNFGEEILKGHLEDLTENDYKELGIAIIVKNALINWSKNLKNSQPINHQSLSYHAH